MVRIRRESRMKDESMTAINCSSLLLILTISVHPV
jgi:hypothetical protein